MTVTPKAVCSDILVPTVPTLGRLGCHADQPVQVLPLSLAEGLTRFPAHAA